MEKFYTGVNIKNWMNKKVEVLDQVDVCGTKLDVPVYLCVDENGETHKVAGTNLSDSTVNYKYAYGGMGDCFPESVERFPSFKGGRYVADWEHVGA